MTTLIFLILISCIVAGYFSCRTYDDYNGISLLLCAYSFMTGAALLVIISTTIVTYNRYKKELNQYKLELQYYKAFEYDDSTIVQVKGNFKEIIKLKANNDTFLFDIDIPDEVDQVYTQYEKELDQIKLMEQ